MYVTIFVCMQQAQRGLNQTGMAGQQANAQRMMRPVMTNSLGLRHLLQQVIFTNKRVMLASCRI